MRAPSSDDNKLYLYYKNDGNCCGIATYIYVQELSADGMSLVGEPARLVRNDAAWEGNVIEAPTMVKHEGKYYLFFSANNYAGVEYAVGYAICDSPAGPCKDAPENPILKSVLQKPPDMVIGPGHQAVITWTARTGSSIMSGKSSAAACRGDRRLMWMDRLDWKDGKPVVEGPTVAAQPAP